MYSCPIGESLVKKCGTFFFPRGPIFESSTPWSQVGDKPATAQNDFIFRRR